MGTVIKSTASKNIGLKRSWGGELYRGQTISIVNRKNKFNCLMPRLMQKYLVANLVDPQISISSSRMVVKRFTDNLGKPSTSKVGTMVTTPANRFPGNPQFQVSLYFKETCLKSPSFSYYPP